MAVGMWVARHYACWILAVACAPQMCMAEGMPPGYFRGTMVSFDGTPAFGTLVARASGGDLFDCSYDGKTYVELEKRRVTPAKLVAGDRLEVLVDRSGRERSCYIRILHVLPPEPLRPVRPPAPKPVARLQPMTTTTLSGVVIKNTNSYVTVRGRDGETTYRLRRDTKFVGAGERLDAASLPLNQRVFVEGGRTLDGDLEAYQITWGGIVTVP